MRRLLLVFDLFWACLCSTAVKAAIVHPPVSANVSVNQLARFNCTAVADVIEWLADKEPVNDEQVHAKGFYASNTRLLNSTIGLRQSNLSVEGWEENDYANITCVAFNFSNILKVDMSDIVLLRVQGLLGSVSNLTVTLIDSTTVLISWSPPFTLEGVPILGYNVTITNNASAKYETMFVKNNALHYSIDYHHYNDYYDWMDNYNSEDEYYVTVAPINVVGTGLNVTSYPFTFPPLPSSTTPTVGSSQTTSGDVTSRGTSPSPSATSAVPTIGVVNQSTQKLLIGSIVPALIVTLLVFVLVVMVVVCVVVKRNRRKKNNAPSDCNRQGSEESFVNEYSSVYYAVARAVPVPLTGTCEEPIQQQETQRPAPFNHITITTQREQNHAQPDNPTVPERVERSSSLIGDSHVLSSSPVSHEWRSGLQRDEYDRPSQGSETPKQPSITSLVQQKRKNSKGYHSIALQSSMSTEDEEDESKQCSQTHDVAKQVNSPGKQPATLSRSLPVNKKMRPHLLRTTSAEEQQRVKKLPTEVSSSPLGIFLNRRLSATSLEYRRNSADSAMKEERKILLEEQC